MADRENATTIDNGDFLITDVRVGAPYPISMPCRHFFIGQELSAKLLCIMPYIERIIKKEMNGAKFAADFVMVANHHQLRFQKQKPTIVINAAHNTNMVPKVERWGKETRYKGSRWLYIVDKLRLFLEGIGLGMIAVEMREFGLQYQEVTPFVQPGLVLDEGPFEQFNRGEGVMYRLTIGGCQLYRGIVSHLQSVSIKWTSWPHNDQYGDFAAVTFEFNRNFDESNWCSFETFARGLLEAAGHDWAELSVLAKWKSNTTRLGW
ncbi:hypothetical protein F4804DRAFT_32568 [Jackrogersella minutella]|nr:hypothetical protein F4804DRAFT_32568 [Jackrogersella minutella]